MPKDSEGYRQVGVRSSWRNRAHLRRIRFRDALGGGPFRGYDLGGDWNGFANVVVPEGEAERMIRKWREDVPRSEWAEVGYRQKDLPPVRNWRINGKTVRARDFSGGYAFSEDRRSR
jgi:hypothetical protein